MLSIHCKKTVDCEPPSIVRCLSKNFEMKDFDVMFGALLTKTTETIDENVYRKTSTKMFYKAQRNAKHVLSITN